jgi:hypothetical protein
MQRKSWMISKIYTNALSQIRLLLSENSIMFSKPLSPHRNLQTVSHISSNDTSYLTLHVIEIPVALDLDLAMEPLIVGFGVLNREGGVHNI